MTVSFPPLTLKASPKFNVTSHSTNPDDQPILEQLSSLIPRLSQDELAALSIATLNEAFEPDTLYAEPTICGSNTFDQCIVLIQDLTKPGKVALVRSITELLAVSLGIVPTVDKPTLPTLPIVPPLHPENAWCVVSIDQAIAFVKAGHMDPAILLWGFSQQSYPVIPSDLLAAANANLLGLMEVLNTPPSTRGQ